MGDNLSTDDLLKIKFDEYVRSICTALTWRGLNATESQVVDDGRAVYTWENSLVSVAMWSAIAPFTYYKPNYLEVYINLQCGGDGVITLNFQWDEEYGDVIEEGEEYELIPLETLKKNSIRISDALEILDEFLLNKGW